MTLSEQEDTANWKENH